MTSKTTVHHFTHGAMNTVFELRLIADDAERAKKAAADCCQRLDALEASLSRYLPGSDVSQINQLYAGDSLFIGEDCYACLRLALSASQATGGLFDITLGRLIEHRKSQEEGPPPELMGQLMIDPDRPRVHCLESGREIDLGGIGKGFALDVLADLCLEWGLSGGLLGAGASTHIAFGESSWKMTLRDGEHRHDLDLCKRALSVSGSSIQGSHIISPLGPDLPYPRQRVWVMATTAAMADAYSTAALLAWNLAEIHQPGIEVLFADHRGFHHLTKDAHSP